jgi:hypothetical protein
MRFWFLPLATATGAPVIGVRALSRDNQLQRTVTRRRWTVRRAAAQLRRKAARFAVAACSVVVAISCGNAAEPLESVQLVNGGAVLSCDYTRPDDSFMFTCRDTHAVFALRCVAVEWSAPSPQRVGQQEFICPVSPERSAFGNALRLRCTANGDASHDELFSRDKLWRTKPDPRLLVDGRMPTHGCASAKVDIE